MLKKYLKLRFWLIHRFVECAHSREESYFILDKIFDNPEVKGAIAEYGAFKGGMSCKLSLIANTLCRQLYIYDSFEGLPDPAIYGTGDQIETYKTKIGRGRNYRGTEEEVKNNIRRFGNFNNCYLIKGLFKDSFDNININHPEKIAFAFVDVDLSLSFKQCINFIWPKLADNGILFCHEARDEEILKIVKENGLYAFLHEGLGNGLSEKMHNLCWIMKNH